MRRSVPNWLISSGCVAPFGCSKRSAGPPALTVRSTISVTSRYGSTSVETRTSSPSRLEEPDPLAQVGGRRHEVSLWLQARAQFAESANATANAFVRPRAAVHERGPARTRRLRTVQAPARTRGERPPTARSARDSLRLQRTPADAAGLLMPPGGKDARQHREPPDDLQPVAEARKDQQRFEDPSWAARPKELDRLLGVSLAHLGPRNRPRGTWPRRMRERHRPVRAGRPRRTAGGELRIAQSPRRASSARGTLRARRRCAEQARFPMLQRPGERGTEVRKLSESRPRRSV